ncbi:MAG: hypothetical protein JWN25_2609 [Verrucomicrobiales bacterium]|nr:hypothetical protein [Verrucomicrobiales bacterium]
MKFLPSVALLAAFIIAFTVPNASAAEVNVTGTWKWNVEIGDLKVTPLVKLKQEASKVTGTFSFNGEEETAISSGKVEKDEISFVVLRMRDDKKVTTNFKGTISGDTITGKWDSDWSGEKQSFDWKAKREGAAKSAAGTYKWTFLTQNGDSIQPVLKLKQEGVKLSGTVTGRDGTETEIKDGKVEGDDVSFNVVREIGGNTVTFKYTGKLTESGIKGKTETNFGGDTQSRDWDAVKQK